MGSAEKAVRQRYPDELQLYRIGCKKQSDLRVLISTHNPALLDALPEEAIPDVAFCYRSPEDGASCLLRLRDMPDYPDLAAQGPVGALMTAGIIDRFAKSRRNEEERIATSLGWLDEIR